MKLKCNFCGPASKKTDDLKLRTIDGRDYLLCKSCDKWSYNYGGTDYEESGANEYIDSIKTTGK